MTMLARDTAMAPQDRNQITVTLSDRALEEYRLVAQYLGMPVATLLRQVVEQHHQSPSFGALVKRAREGISDFESKSTQ
jgi:hypothetical protein